jgi:hypothetical protein
MSARVSGSNQRAFFTLSAIGAGWVQKTDSLMDTPVCNECLAYNREVFLYSQPTYDPASSSTRKNIRLLKSTDLINWEFVIQLTDYISGGYSNIIFTDSKLGVLYEGKNSDINYANLDYLLPVVMNNRYSFGSPETPPPAEGIGSMTIGSTFIIS